MTCCALHILEELLHSTSRLEAAIRIRTIIAAWLACLALSASADAADLKPEAVQGFERYTRLTEGRMQGELQTGGNFLWVDGLPGDRRGEDFRKLQQGEVITARLETHDASNELHTPGALIHHWVGTVFIPGASLLQVLALLQDYDRHSIYYSPEVSKSKTLEHPGDDFKVYLRLTRKKIITVVLDTDYDVHYQRLDNFRAQSFSYSTRIAEVEHAGESSETTLSPGRDHGFMWRLNSYWRFSESEPGVYVQCEAISLTRDIPTGLQWLIGPFIESIPKESLEFTLGATRAAVLGRSTHAPR
jgi:hypothetical protein